MKIFYFLLVLSLFIYACNKSAATTETLNPEDLTAAAGMSTEISVMQLSLDNLISASDANQRRHWDSAYHHHDSLFWHHHNNYHHNVYLHDDHSHQWIPYDPAVNHHNHHHPHYPGHLNDSLIVINNNHHHTNCDHHAGHHICHHHTMQTLHHLHNLHHP
ncbi:MAG: hypothetical protein ABIR30_00840 [Chitinophagaceae bacterium]